jgi:hypothetical protein
MTNNAAPGTNASPTVARRGWTRLFASAPGNDGGSGGVFAVDEHGAELLDPVPTTGMTLSADGTQLARLGWVEGRSEVSELYVSDRSGLLAYRRLDDVGEPHSLQWFRGHLYAVSTHTNSVVRLDLDGTTETIWSPAGLTAHGDCWHLNSLAVADDRLFVSAFGAFDTVRGWSEAGRLDGAGLVVDIERDAIALSGFGAPHDPTWEGDGWLICNSLSGEIWRLDRSGRRVGSVELGGWTRGVLVANDEIYVGVSAHRLARTAVRAHIAVLDRSTLTEVGRFELPSRDVFALCPYDDGLANGLRVGDRLGAAGVMGSPDVVMDRPLSATDSLARLELEAATPTSVTVRLTNTSGVIMSGFGRHPVRVGARWWDTETSDWVHVSRADLVSPLYPHRSVTVEVALPSLPPSGTPLQLCVLQEMVRWFDEVSDAAAVEMQPRDMRRPAVS